MRLSHVGAGHSRSSRSTSCAGLGQRALSHLDLRRDTRLNIASVTDLIDKATKEIKQDEDKVVYKSLEEIGDDLPDHSPRFVLLSYPMTLVSTRSLRRAIGAI